MLEEVWTPILLAGAITLVISFKEQSNFNKEGCYTWYCRYVSLPVGSAQYASQVLPSCKRSWEYSYYKILWAPSYKTKRWEKGITSLAIYH